MLGLAGMAVSVKYLSQSMSVWQVLFLRGVFALAILSPALYRAGPRVFKTDRPWVHIIRSGFGMAGMVCFFFALKHLDLALVTTLAFARVLFMIICAVLFLGEIIRWRRASATVVGFLGVVVCLQPGGDGFNPWTLVALASALGGVGVTTMIKRLTSTDSPLTITIYAYFIMGGVALVPALLSWKNPSLAELGALVAMGACSALGQTSVAQALKAGDASAVTPFEYSRLLWAVLFGYFLFGEVPAASTWLGGVIIVASGVYIALREARLGKAGKSPEPEKPARDPP